MSHGETSRRLNAAKLVRRFPSLLGRIERGELHLSSLKILGSHLTESNVELLLDEARGRSKMEVQQLVAQHFPRPDVPELVMELAAAPAQVALAAPATGAPVVSTPTAAPALPSRIEPLSEKTVVVQMTMSKEGYALLTRAMQLASHRIPNGNRVAVVEAALKCLSRSWRRSSSARRRVRRRRRVGPSRATSRKRRGGRSSSVTARNARTWMRRGRRCESRTRLELDHIKPRGQGGGDEASNLRVTCRPHNKLYAEEAYGKDFVAERIHCRQRQSRRVMNAERVMEAAAVQVQLPAPSLSPATVTTSTPVETIELASRGLVNMGFPKADVRRAVDAICARHAGDAMRVESLLREAITALN